MLMYICMYKCHRHGNWVKEKTERFRCIYSIWGSSMVPVWMPADVQMNGNVSDVHVQQFSCWKIKADDCDVMK